MPKNAQYSSDNAGWVGGDARVLSCAGARRDGDLHAGGVLRPAGDACPGKAGLDGALPTLKNLALGRRMGRLAAGFGEKLEIKPILTSRGGKLELLEKVRTWKKAKQRLVELAIASAADGTIGRIGLIHVNNEEGAQALYGSLSEVLPLPDSPILAEFTPGLSVHTGSGVIAFVFLMAK